MATSTVENYLKQLYLEQRGEDGGMVPMGRVAAAMGVVPGTATSMVKALADSGLVEYEPRGGVRLTRSGEQLALHVLRRHRLVELFLVKVLGLDWSVVHDEADMLEHAISDRVLERMDALLGHPTADPHGDPIPTAKGHLHEPRRMSLVDCPMDVPQTVARHFGSGCGVFAICGTQWAGAGVDGDGGEKGDGGGGGEDSNWEARGSVVGDGGGGEDFGGGGGEDRGEPAVLRTAAKYTVVMRRRIRGWGGFGKRNDLEAGGLGVGD